MHPSTDPAPTPGEQARTTDTDERLRALRAQRARARAARLRATSPTPATTPTHGPPARTLAGPAPTSPTPGPTPGQDTKPGVVTVTPAPGEPFAQAAHAGLDANLIASFWDDPRALDRARREVETRARCAHGPRIDPEEFFPVDAAPRHQRAAQKKAAALCAGCPVARACLTWAVATGQTYGTWGGRPEHEVRALARRFKTLAPPHATTRRSPHRYVA